MVTSAMPMVTPIFLLEIYRIILYPWWSCHPHPLLFPYPVVLGSISCKLAVLTHLLFLANCILAFTMCLLNFLGLWNWKCKKCFPCFLMRLTAVYNKQMASKKRELFNNLQGFVGPSGKLSLLEEFLIKSIAKNQHLQFERFVVAAGENMHQVADGSMDVVVLTRVLCSVENQEQILQEECRVPRGELGGGEEER
uniref:Methyltransferase type 11 domain-containing protein n=1 Tax=Molossus molossus TaxID=27622 RepID=A0A7J8G001_MOLMO|nr:hypothetical protein HJG59_008255 [Molossus molossus]